MNCNFTENLLILHFHEYFVFLKFLGRSASPATASRGQSLRDLSPRPRAMDSRAAAVAAQLTREAAAAQQGRGGPTSSDPRLDPRYIAAASQALAAEQQHQRDSRNNPGLISGLPEPRGDPKADIPNLHKSDPRAGLQRAQPASTLSRSGFFLGASTTASAMPNQQVILLDFFYLTKFSFNEF